MIVKWNRRITPRNVVEQVKDLWLSPCFTRLSFKKDLVHSLRVVVLSIAWFGIFRHLMIVPWGPLHLNTTSLPLSTFFFRNQSGNPKVFTKPKLFKHPSSIFQCLKELKKIIYTIILSFLFMFYAWAMLNKEDMGQPIYLSEYCLLTDVFFLNKGLDKFLRDVAISHWIESVYSNIFCYTECRRESNIRALIVHSPIGQLFLENPHIFPKYADVSQS